VRNSHDIGGVLVPTEAHPVVAEAKAAEWTGWPDACRGAPVAATSIGAASAGTARHLPLVGTFAPLPVGPSRIFTRHGPLTVIDTARGPGKPHHGILAHPGDRGPPG
jgi:hypothetical protein